MHNFSRTESALEGVIFIMFAGIMFTSLAPLF